LISSSEQSENIGTWRARRRAAELREGMHECRERVGRACGARLAHEVLVHVEEDVLAQVGRHRRDELRHVEA
jgi:hypothetical protein